MQTTPISRALNGALERHADGWHWRDGTREPRVRDMLLSHIAPNFRCMTRGHITYVEIPARWRDARYWPNGRVDDDAAMAIEQLIGECGTREPIYAEGIAELIDDHRLTTDGWIVDVAQWDSVMREPIGVWWDTAHEAEILARAQRLAP